MRFPTLATYLVLFLPRPAANLGADGDRPASLTFHVTERGKSSRCGNLPAPIADGTDGSFVTPPPSPGRGPSLLRRARQARV
jgi:hypothetical protein